MNRLFSRVAAHYKQYGLLYLLKKSLVRPLEAFFKRSAFYVLAIDDHEPKQIDTIAAVVDNKNYNEFLASDIGLNPDLRRQLKNFIPDNAYAVVVRFDNSVSGWGFVQKSGLSKYGGFDYLIPEDTFLLKNLFVLPECRGQSIGKVINKERINSIPKGVTPIVFVLQSNSVAIRNLEMFGFIKCVLVKDYLFFGRIHKRTIKELIEGNIGYSIVSGFS